MQHDGPESIMTGEEYDQSRSNGVVSAAAANHHPVSITHLPSSRQHLINDGHLQDETRDSAFHPPWDGTMSVSFRAE